MSKILHARLSLATTAENAIFDADIVVTATTSTKPVFDLHAIKPGAHINAMGANSATRMEIDPNLVRKCAYIGTDDVVQARKEAAEFLALEPDFDWRHCPQQHGRDALQIARCWNRGSGHSLPLFRLLDRC
jgi:ornithine cyclodeaminase/alanine dehydrogenase-like protein (mu-crystallin family)